jgi:hypothetical protein
MKFDFKKTTMLRIGRKLQIIIYEIIKWTSIYLDYPFN